MSETELTALPEIGDRMRFQAPMHSIDEPAEVLGYSTLVHVRLPERGNMVVRVPASSLVRG